jgi:hypothetical protein
MYEREQRRSLTRAITAMALGGRGDGRADFVRRVWPHDSGAETILKAAVSPTSTSSYPSYTTAKTLPALAPQSAAVRLFSLCMQIDLAGVAKVRIPLTAATPQPGFIGEGSAAPLAQLSLAGVDLGPAKKILILSAVTGELDQATPEAASVVIGRALAEATARSLDAAVFSSVAADATRPAGLLNGLTPITASTGGTDVELIATDLGALAGSIADANIATDDMVIVASPAQAIKLRLLSSPNFTNTVIGSNAIADGTIIAIAPGGLATAYSGVPDIETSKEATVHFEDTSPLQIASGAQGSGVLATPTRSAFQQDLIIIRVRCRTAWAALPGSVAVITGVGW